MASGSRTVDKMKICPAFWSTSAPSSASPKWVSMKGYNNCTIVIRYTNLAAGATGTAVTVNQAKYVNGANSKAVALDYYWYSTDITNSVVLSQGVVSSNTFTTDNTASMNGIAILEVRADRLDRANGFQDLQVGLGNATNTTVEAWYLMGNWPRFAGSFDEMINPLAD